MKNETSLELLKLATQLACATISQNTHGTGTKRTADKEGAVQTILKDCLKAMLDNYNELLDSAK